jgi:predicted O-methyltransferase YrrM
MGHLSTLSYLRRTSAPAACLAAFVRTVVRRKTRSGRTKWQRFREMQRAFRGELPAYQFSKDWFTGKIPYWLDGFDRCGMRGGPIEVLEIGSWEGLSSLFILRTFDRARITCIDSWDDSNGAIAVSKDVITDVERRFDENLTAYRDRVTKRKETSLRFFGDAGQSGPFDLIYVDGSHHADDVMVDALESFSLLKVGGVMIFDDYLAKYYERLDENPAKAINLFLRLKRNRYEFVSVYYQLIIRKTSQ